MDIKKALFSEGFRVMQTCFRYRTHMSAGWRLSPYPAYEELQYQTVTQISVGTRKRSAAGQFLKIALGQQDEALFSEGFRVIQTCFRYRTHMSAGWRLSPYPAYEKLQYQTVTQISVGPRKRSAAGQFLKIAPGQHDEALFSEGFRVIQTCFRYRTHLSAGWRLSPFPAYEKLKYQTVTQISVGTRKRSAAGQFLKIALGQQDEALFTEGFYRTIAKINA
ncbi:TPA: hypothetical protein L9M21_003607 [Klebsiella quasipneumoniae subsp. quasipneumoniae]|nr:hypothetical protein [Klebsiella quasipneumoniae subsp. quasipneumoniae]